MGDATAIFSIHDQKDIEIHEVVQQVYDALKEKGYNPVNQLVGCILSEDPTYITTYKEARSLIRKVTVTTCCRLCCAATSTCNTVLFSPAVLQDGGLFLRVGRLGMASALLWPCSEERLF